MSLYNDYCAFTGKTAIYPQHVALEYLTLGLCSEAAECVELLHGRKTIVHLTNEIGSELGDCQWYAARIAHTLDLDFASIVNAAKRDYRMTVHSVDVLLERIAVQSGLIAGKVKKQIRDGDTWNGEQREDARRYIQHCLSEIVLLSMHITDWLYTHHNAEYSSYDKVLNMNRAKLQSRLERGALRGDGNAR